MDYAKLKSKLEQNEDNDKRERSNIIKRLDENEVRYSKKFDELFDSRNKTNETLIELTTTLKLMTSNMNQQFSNLEKKIDEIKNKKRGE